MRSAPRFMFYLADTARAVITVDGVRFSLNPKLQVAVRRLESLDDAENDIDEKRMLRSHDLTGKPA